MASYSLDLGYMTRYNAVRNKLFAHKAINAIALHIHHQDNIGGSCVSETPIITVADLQDYIWQISKRLSHDTVFIIPQQYSWGRFHITDAAFKILIDSTRVFAQFLGIVAAFGVKTSEDERVTYGWQSCAYRKQCSQERHEICYNILYVDRHGRDLSDPWSLRQTGIYHQMCDSFETSRWILLNPPDYTKSHMREYFESKRDHCYLGLHAELLISMGAHWTDYIEYLSADLRKHDEKACYSIVNNTKGNGYYVSYTDLQELHMLQTKIQRADAAVESCLDIAKGCKGHFATHLEPDKQAVGWKECCKLVDRYLADNGRHLKCLRRLDRRLQSTLNLFSRILVFRNAELLQESNRASCKTLGMLLTIADQGKLQQESLSRLLVNGQADTGMLKALSMVATVYLPASLVATILSSNLVQTVAQGPQADASSLVLSPQFWVYIAITLPLMGLTLAWTLYLNHKSRHSTHNSTTVPGWRS